MNHRTYIALFILVAVIVGGAFLVERHSESTPAVTATAVSTTTPEVVSGTASTSTTDSSTPTATPAPAAPSSYTAAEVATHASAASCWTSIDGSVYDVTSWISQHPGGRAAILSLCGKDGTQAFEGQHGGQARPEQELATFKIGALAS